ncbi:MAG: hypothetical protein FWF81_07650 [Defluviitaleaceae bacterium]|nr:hypothetical protein [Defluviitaleaceae bacterium]
MKCGRCGNELNDGWVVCPECGVTVNPTGSYGEAHSINNKIYAAFGITIVIVAIIFLINKDVDDSVYIGEGRRNISIFTEQALDANITLDSADNRLTHCLVSDQTSGIILVPESNRECPHRVVIVR